MVHLEDDGDPGHGGDPVGACVEPGSEYDHLLDPRAEGHSGRSSMKRVRATAEVRAPGHR